MKRVTLLLLIQSLCFCSSAKEGSILNLSVETRNITSLAKDTGVPTDSIGNPAAILSIDDYIVLAGYDIEYAISIYNLKTGFFQRVGRMGRGENEIQNVGQLGIYPAQGKTAFFVFDNFVDKLYVYSLEGDVCELWKSESMIGFAQFVFDGNVAIGPAYTEDRYLIKDFSTGLETSFGDTKYATELRNSTDGTLRHPVINEEKKLMMCFSPYGEACEMVDFSDRDDIGYPFHRIYMSVVGSADSEYISVRTKIGFLDAAGNDEYIFALCSDKTAAELLMTKADPGAANDVCVFDWKGDYVKRLICDNSVKYISVNRARKELFALVIEDAHYKVVSFPLNEIL